MAKTVVDLRSPEEVSARGEGRLPPGAELRPMPISSSDMFSRLIPDTRALGSAGSSGVVGASCCPQAVSAISVMAPINLCLTVLPSGGGAAMAPNFEKLFCPGRLCAARSSYRDRPLREI